MGGKRQPRAHAVYTRAADLPTPKPRPGGINGGKPYVPEPGEFVIIRTSVYGYDVAEWRRCVVYEVSPVPEGYIRVATRTSATAPDVDGVPHPADPELHCDKNGTFVDPGLVKKADWTSHNVLYMGVLGQPYLDEVLAWFR